MTGPALSATIRQLEDELGLVLLDRTTRGAALTKAGKVLAVEARRVLASVDRAIAETRRSGELGYELRVASSPWLPLERLFGFLRPLGAADMDALVRVSYMFAPEQQQRIAAAELELGIFPWIRPIPSLDHEPLYVGEYLRAFMAADHPLAAEPVFRPRDELREETLFALAEANPPLTVWLRRQAEKSRLPVQRRCAGRRRRDPRHPARDRRRHRGRPATRLGAGGRRARRDRGQPPARAAAPAAGHGGCLVEPSTDPDETDPGTGAHAGG